MICRVLRLESDKLCLAMNYIIDGHNLIGKLPGLSLSMPDDEQRLVELLVRFSRRGRQRVEVYFDGAPPGQSGEVNYGRVKAHFVLHSSTADQAIRTRLGVLGRASRNWAVVTSDRSVQAAAHAAHAQVLASEDFARRLLASLGVGSPDAGEPLDQPLSEDEVREWLQVFKQGGKRGD